MQLVDRIRIDLAHAQKELELNTRMVAYLKTLLESAEAPELPDLTIAEAITWILKEESPLSATEIAARVIAKQLLDCDDVEQARSKISAVVSRDKKSDQPRFVHIGRGKITLLCQASKDGDCTWPGCPQNRDNEPDATGRHCPLDMRVRDEAETP